MGNNETTVTTKRLRLMARLTDAQDEAAGAMVTALSQKLGVRVNRQDLTVTALRALGKKLGVTWPEGR